MKNTRIHLRFAGEEDAALVADLSRKTFYESFAPQNTEENMRLYMDQQFTREMQMAEVGAPGRTFILAYVDEEPAGYASMRATAEKPKGLESENAIEIVQIYSEQKMIGKGVGKALMQACLDTARALDKEWVWLGVWGHNQRAI